MPDGRLTVFLADDNLLVREGVRALLSMADDLEVVGTAEDYDVSAAAELRPDLVLMDVNLPGIDGLEATRLIREQSAGAVTVLLLSTYEAEDYAGRAVECGAAGFIPKSQFGPERLAEAWESAAAA